MDPILVSLVAALVAGATAAAGDVATSAVKDAYAGLKRLVIDRYGGAVGALESVEKEPASKEKQQDLAEALATLGVAKDAELKAGIESFLGSIERLQPALVDVQVLHALKNFTIRDVEYFGTLLRAQSMTVGGNAVIEGIRMRQPENTESDSGGRAAPAVVIGKFSGRDLIFQLILDPFWRHPVLFALGALGCLLVVLIAAQIKSADLISGLTSAVTSYMSIVVAILTTPTKFVQNLHSQTGEEADRAAAAGIGFYLLNYAGSVVLLSALARFHDVTWLCKWLIGGSLIGLAMICGGSVISVATQAAGSGAAINQIIALIGYLSGTQVLGRVDGYRKI